MRLINASLFTAMLLLSPLAIAGAADVEYHAPNADRPYSEAVRVGNMLYLAGQLGFDAAAGKLVEGGIASETKQTLENIKTIVEKYGSSMSELVQCTVYLADIGEWGAMNDVYVTFFPENRPTRAAIGSSGLSRGARTEIVCVATVNN